MLASMTISSTTVSILLLSWLDLDFPFPFLFLFLEFLQKLSLSLFSIAGPQVPSISLFYPCLGLGNAP